ncbi:4'-phosphopantetheinyl transferase family protein [Trinickia dinghuensis]|nr:4'-phosphopantetheinyl transferase superfamily protein [Trinickia dinghuensis]
MQTKIGTIDTIGGDPAAAAVERGWHALDPRMLDLMTLAPGDVDIWVAIVADAPDAELSVQFDEVLIEEERKKHAKFLFEKDRRRYLVTRSLVRYVLSRYMPIAPADWRFEATAFGRPVIANAHPGVSGFTFNISHSDRVVVLGVTRERRLGIDVEDIDREMPLDVADRFFSAIEVQQLQSLPAHLQPARFLDFWTLKESYIKACGKGLSLPLDQFGFDFRGEAPLRVHFDPRLNDAPENWSFRQWRPCADSVAALCVENRPTLSTRIAVRRVVPFVREQEMAFDVLRRSA